MLFVTCFYMMSFFMIIKVALLDMQNAGIASSHEEACPGPMSCFAEIARSTTSFCADIIGIIAVSTCKRSLFIIVVRISAVAIPVAQQDAPSAKR